MSLPLLTARFPLRLSYCSPELHLPLIKATFRQLPARASLRCLRRQDSSEGEKRGRKEKRRERDRKGEKRREKERQGEKRREKERKGEKRREKERKGEKRREKEREGERGREERGREG